jgi:hypothetical protein
LPACWLHYAWLAAKLQSGLLLLTFCVCLHNDFNSTSCCVLCRPAGVLPGCYEVVWVVDVRKPGRAAWRELTFTLSAEALPAANAKEQQQERWAPVGGTPSAAAAAGKTADAESKDDDTIVNFQMRQYGQADVQLLQQQCRKQRTTWAVMSGGLLHVSSSSSGASTVRLSFHSTEVGLNGNIFWAMARLIPVDMPQFDSATVCNRVWHPLAGQQGIGAAGARFRCYAQRWLELLMEG